MIGLFLGILIGWIFFPCLRCLIRGEAKKELGR